MHLSAGYRSVEVVDEATGVPTRLLLFYPATDPEIPGRLGPFPVQLAWQAPVAPGPWPLVAVSHGTGSSPALHAGWPGTWPARDSPFVLPWHAGNNRDDDRLAGRAELLAHRPRQLRQAVDLATAELGEHLAEGRVAVVGTPSAGTPPRPRPAGAPAPWPPRPPPSRDSRSRSAPIPGWARWSCSPRPPPGTPTMARSTPSGCRSWCCAASATSTPRPGMPRSSPEACARRP